MEEKHYVYFIVHKEQNKRYYGVRTDKHLNTPDIFTGEYNTSSKDSDFVDEFTNHKDRFTITVEYFPTRISAEKQKSRKAEKQRSFYLVYMMQEIIQTSTISGMKRTSSLD
jgi:recombination DNA repair RAD52 pathway protein